MREDSQINQSSVDIIQSMVSAQPGITLAELFSYAVGVSRDEIYFMIAYGVVYLDLRAAPIVEPERCLVFCDEEIAESYGYFLLSKTASNAITVPVVDLTPGTPILYDGKVLTISLVGESNLLLQTEESSPIEIGMETFDRLLCEGKISSLRSPDHQGLSVEVMEIFKRASGSDLEEANKRYRKIQPYLNGEPIKAGTEAERSIHNWLKKFHYAEQRYGYGYIGLIHIAKSKGNRNRKLPDSTLETINNFIEQKYENKKQKRKYEVYAQFVAQCNEQGLTDDLIPSYKTFIAEVKRRSGHQQTLVRAGHRAAYDQEVPYWELELTTPRHGDFPFHYCYLDHTEGDIELRCSRTGKNLGKPWISFLVDGFSRRILAVYITYDAPSYRSCMAILRVCVLRFSRLPQTLIVDNGPDFHSTYFESLLLLFDCTIKHRPATKSRFSATCERLFGTSNTQLLYNLAGNTQITKKVRLMTKSVNPKELSLWTIGLLFCHLCEWAYELYDTTEHPALGQSPRDSYASGITLYGHRNHKRIPYDQHFYIVTLPAIPRATAKVQPMKGVKYDHKDYWCNAFRDPEIEHTRVEVRYDPFNAGHVFAYVHGQWIECFCEHYALFKGRSEKEVQQASEELRKRSKNHAKNYKIRARQLGVFLNNIDSQEVLLEQRLKDAQQREVIQVIEGGVPNITPYTLTYNNTHASSDASAPHHQFEQHKPEQQSEDLFKEHQSEQQSDTSQPTKSVERRIFKSY